MFAFTQDVSQLLEAFPPFALGIFFERLCQPTPTRVFDQDLLLFGSRVSFLPVQKLQQPDCSDVFLILLYFPTFPYSVASVYPIISPVVCVPSSELASGSGLASSGGIRMYFGKTI